MDDQVTPVHATGQRYTRACGSRVGEREWGKR